MAISIKSHCWAEGFNIHASQASDANRNHVHNNNINVIYISKVIFSSEFRVYFVEWDLNQMRISLGSVL